ITTISFNRLTDSLSDANNFLTHKRMKTIPSKFRDPFNTDNEIITEEKKRRWNENKKLKLAKRKAAEENMKDFLIFPQVDPPLLTKPETTGQTTLKNKAKRKADKHSMKDFLFSPEVSPSLLSKPQTPGRFVFNESQFSTQSPTRSLF